MKKWFLFIPVLALCVISCRQDGPQNSYTVNGDISGFQDSTYLFLRYPSGDSTHLDSALVKDGKFTFSGSVNNPSAAMIFEPESQKRFMLYLENSKITVKGNADSLQNVIITGSATQDDADALKLAMQPVTDSMNALREVYMKAMNENDEATMNSINEKADAIQDKQTDILKRFIEDHPKSFVSLSQFQSLMYSTDYNELEKLYKNFDASLQSSSMGKTIGEVLDKMRKTSIGQQAPDFTQDDSTGKAINLADFKGKYVLIDFWASWCGPCRAENPNVVKAYNNFKDKGFTILGVSLDEDRDKWLKAIKDDGLVWEQVSDLKGWKNEVADEYGVRAIPANFLLDPDGKIIGHNLRGEKLIDKLKEVL